MAFNFTLAMNPTRVAQVVVGGAALLGGYKVASEMIRTAYREDLLGDPTRIVEVDDTTMIYQTREAQGGKLTNIMLGAGAVSAAVGGILAMGAPAGLTGVKAAIRGAGGLLLIEW